MADNETSWQPEQLPVAKAPRAARGGAPRSTQAKTTAPEEDLAHLAPVKVTWKPEPPAPPKPGIVERVKGLHPALLIAGGGVLGALLIWATVALLSPLLFSGQRVDSPSGAASMEVPRSWFEVPAAVDPLVAADLALQEPGYRAEVLGNWWGAEDGDRSSNAIYIAVQEQVPGEPVSAFDRAAFIEGLTMTTTIDYVFLGTSEFVHPKGYEAIAVESQSGPATSPALSTFVVVQNDNVVVMGFFHCTEACDLDRQAFLDAMASVSIDQVNFDG